MKVKTLYGDIEVPIEKGTQNGEKKKLSGYVILAKFGLTDRAYLNYLRIKTKKEINMQCLE